MKLSTTTLGCPGWDLATVLTRLQEYGFGGVDFRGLKGEFKLWRLPEFAAGLKDTAARIRDHGLAVTCVSSGIHLGDTRPESIAAYDEELLRSAEICGALDCPHIRVFGGSLGLAGGRTEAQRAEVIELVADRARAMAQRAGAIAPVDLLIETHDAWTSSAHVRALLERIGRQDVACCWDVKHTYWASRETPETTWAALGPWVRNTHWKDVRRFRGSAKEFGRDLSRDGLLCLVGTGILPLADCHDLLQASDYKGWFTLEWEKHWHPHIEEPEIAFPRFVQSMRELAGAASGAKTR